MWTESFSRLGWGDLASSQIKHKIWSVAASKRKEYMQKTHALWEGLGQLRCGELLTTVAGLGSRR